MSRLPPNTRRRFLRRACTLASGGGLGAALSSLRMTQLVANAQGGDDYKALVCLFLFGGNDGLNTLVPRAGADYERYREIRAALGIDAGELIAIGNPGGDGKAYGLHPSLPELAGLHAQGDLAWVANVGSLAYPVTKAQYGFPRLMPLQLFSHREQFEQWQTSIPVTSDTGWGGRLADYVAHLNGSNTAFMSVSLAGANFFEVGRQVFQYGMTTEGSVGLEGVSGDAAAAARRVALGGILGRQRSHLLESAYSDVMSNALERHEELSAALSNQAPLATVFPDDSLGKQLRMIARMVGARSVLGLKRQVFFCAIGGFDTHDNQLEAQPGLLREVSAGVGAFQQAMGELGVTDKVTLFSASDFGRSALTNGRGSDHGWGNHHFVVGGAVRGGRIYGRMPEIRLDGPDDAGGTGRWIPGIAVDQYAATMARWFGVPDADLEEVVPNLGRFVSRDLGFMDS